MATTTQKDVPSQGKAHQEPRTSASIGWSPEKVRSAETRANSGYFESAADLCECIMADDRASAALDRLYSFVSLPLHFELPGVDSKDSAKDPIVQALDNDWYKALPEQVAGEIVRWLSLLGHCWLHIREFVRDPETGRAVPAVECWHQRNFRFDTGSGQWLAKVSAGWTSTEEIPIASGDGRWVHLTRYGANWRSAMKAPWRGIGRWWLLKQYAAVDWAASSERHGLGQTFVESTAGNTRSLNKAQREDLAADIATLGRNGVMVLPDGFKATLVTDGANTYATFREQLMVANSAINLSLLGTNLTTEVNGGSFAAASVHESVDAQKAQGLLGGISTGTRDQLWTLWARLNFGDGAVTPYAVWDTEPPPNKEAQSKVLLQASQGIQNLVSVGMPVSKAWVAEFTGVRMAETPEDTLVAPKEPGGPGEPTAQASRRSHVLARSGASSGSADPLGDYQQGLERACCAHASKHLAPTVASVIAAVSKAGGYEEARDLVAAAYSKVAPPTRLAELTEAALIMGQMAGVDVLEQEMRED